MSGAIDGHGVQVSRLLSVVGLLLAFEVSVGAVVVMAALLVEPAKDLGVGDGAAIFEVGEGRDDLSISGGGNFSA